MFNRYLFAFSLILFACLALNTPVLADEPPGWLTQAATVQTPLFEIKDVPAVVVPTCTLLDIEGSCRWIDHRCWNALAPAGR